MKLLWTLSYDLQRVLQVAEEIGQGRGRVTWVGQENVPGEFPFTGGVFPFKREGEDPTRMFAGEGGPERTNKRFHYVSLGMPAKRSSVRLANECPISWIEISEANSCVEKAQMLPPEPP